MSKSNLKDKKFNNDSTEYIPTPTNTYSPVIPDSTKNSNLKLDLIQTQSKLKKGKTEQKEGK